VTVVKIYRNDDTGWHVAAAPGTEPRLPVEVDWKGAGRKFLAQGDGGFSTQLVRIPPGFTAPVHSHDHAEVFVVLEGGCTFGDESMGCFDLTVVEANEPYGFTAGPDGLLFLVVRQAPAAYTTTGG
jgi:mannose-6-phosphate isomerase-like protein (cupin superfamily)